MTYYDVKVYQDGMNTIAADKNGVILSSVPTSANTDNIPIQAAIDAVPAGGTIILSGSFHFAFKLIVTKSLNVIGESASLEWNIHSRDLFMVTGTLVSTVNLSADAVHNSRELTVTDASQISKGMLVLVNDTAVWNALNYPNLKTGELHLVSSVNGNNILITDPTINDYLTSRDAKVDIIQPVTFRISNVKIFSDTLSEMEGRGISVKYGLNSRITDCLIYGMGLRAIEIYNSYDSLVSRCTIHSCRLSGYGYGVCNSDAVARVTIENNHIYNCRHNITTSSYAKDYGQARDVRIINNTLDGSEISASLDMHPCVVNAVIDGNTITSPNIDIHNTYIGVKRAIITNNTFTGGQGLLARGHIHNCDWIISNNTFNGTYYGFYAGPPGATWSQVKFIGNVAHEGPVKTIASPSPITTFVEL